MAKASSPFPYSFLHRAAALVVSATLCIGVLPSQAAEALASAQGAQDQAPVVADTSPAALDQVMAPIALYPDALLMQILAASVNAQEVLDAGNWLLENPSLEGIALDEAAKRVGFGVPMTALLHFPEVVDQMCTNLDWTRQVGADFSADQAAVLDSIQRLRAQAQQAGNLRTTPQQTVATQTDNGKQVIVIQPANPQVVYVPQYDPQTVYVSGPSTGDVAAASIISFGVGMAIGSLFSNNNYYYAPRWGYGGIYYGGRPWYPRSYVYRPVYGPHYRPAYGYRPPANYPYHRPYYNSNYYNRYRPGNNNRPGNGNGYNKPGNGNNGGYNRPGNGTNGGYNKPGNNQGNNRPGNSGNSPGYNKPGNGGYNKPGNNGGNNRPGNAGGGFGGGNTTRPAPDKGYAKPGNGGGQQSRPGNQSQTRPGKAGGGGARPPAQTQQQRPQQTRPAPAFAGGGSNKSVNAASQRGAASSANRGGAGSANSSRRPK